MRKAEALVARVAKSVTSKPLTIEQAFEKVLTNPANLALARAALRPRSVKTVPSQRKNGDEDEDETDGESTGSYEDDGGNTAHNAGNAVIGRIGTDADKTGRPASATRKFDLSGRKAKITARVRKFFGHVPRRQRRSGIGVRDGAQEGEEGARGEAQGGLNANPRLTFTPAGFRRAKPRSAPVQIRSDKSWGHYGLQERHLYPECPAFRHKSARVRWRLTRAIAMSRSDILGDTLFYLAIDFEFAFHNGQLRDKRA